MLIGYARVSTQDQNLELQWGALIKAGCQKVFEGLAKTLEMLREGDTLVVWKLDRLGRSVKNLVDLVGELHKQGIQFKGLVKHHRHRHAAYWNTSDHRSNRSNTDSRCYPLSVICSPRDREESPVVSR